MTTAQQATTPFDGLTLADALHLKQMRRNELTIAQTMREDARDLLREAAEIRARERAGEPVAEWEKSRKRLLMRCVRDELRAARSYGRLRRKFSKN